MVKGYSEYFNVIDSILFRFFGNFELPTFTGELNKNNSSRERVLSLLEFILEIILIGSMMFMP